MAKKRGKSRVPRELERAGALCLAFANTGVPRRDDRRRDGKAPPSLPLGGYGELLAWALRMGAVDAAAGDVLRREAAERPQDAAAAVARATGLRSAIERIFNGRVLGRKPRSEDVAWVSALLHLRAPVAMGEGFRWQWIADGAELERPLWPIAQSAAELLVSGEIGRVRQCGTRGCYQLFLPGNKQKRIWCDANTCGSRAKGKRYRVYKRELGRGPMKPLGQLKEEMRRFKRVRREQDELEKQRPIPEDSRATDG